MVDVRTRVEPEQRYRAVERVVGLAELDEFITGAIAELGDGPDPPFAIYHGQVNDQTSSRVEVGLPDAAGDRVLPGGPAVYGTIDESAADYEGIHVVYDAVKDYLVENGLTQRGPTREVYRGGLIEVVWPVVNLL